MRSRMGVRSGLRDLTESVPRSLPPRRHGGPEAEPQAASPHSHALSNILSRACGDPLGPVSVPTDAKPALTLVLPGTRFWDADRAPLAARRWGCMVLWAAADRRSRLVLMGGPGRPGTEHTRVPDGIGGQGEDT